ncbi:MAG: 4-hydroxy-tetrahydrodipicolinate reductase [Phycisphaerae bacterium]
MMKPIRLAICGAAGRMGLRIVTLAHGDPENFSICQAIDRPDSPRIGSDIFRYAGLNDSGLELTGDLEPDFDVLIDFSQPTALAGNLAVCRQFGRAAVIGTTGLSMSDHDLISAASEKIPILQANNTSVGVNWLVGMLGAMANQLGSDYEIEIVEMHHDRKKDAPSGTALTLAETICSATGRDLRHDVVFGRHGDNVVRQHGQIGIHAVRMGDVVGEHTVYFSTGGERLEVRHVATSRDTFARGALRAASYLFGRPAGRYTMRHVLQMN